MRRYEQAIGAGATVLAFDLHAAPRFAEIRRDRSIRAPDAIQLACASAAGTDLFVTNDERPEQEEHPGDSFHSVAWEGDVVRGGERRLRRRLLPGCGTLMLW